MKENTVLVAASSLNGAKDDIKLMRNTFRCSCIMKKQQLVWLVIIFFFFVVVVVRSLTTTFILLKVLSFQGVALGNKNPVDEDKVQNLVCISKYKG